VEIQGELNDVAYSLERCETAIAGAGLELRAARRAVPDREEALESLRVTFRNLVCARKNLQVAIRVLQTRVPTTHGV